MSLKNYIKQVEQLNEAPIQPLNGQGQPISGQQQQPAVTPGAPAAPAGQPAQAGVATAPAAPGAQQPQQPQSPSTTAPAQPAAAGQQQQQQAGAAPSNLPGMEEIPLSEDGTQEVQLDEALTRIKENHPYEHKQFLEGWGMDSGLFEALAEHYFKEGKIPRAIWHGPLQELKEFVEECYAKDNGVGGNQDAINSGMLDEEGMEEGIEDRVGANPVPEKDPAKQNSFNTPAYQRKAQENGEKMSSLEQRLKETDMFESKKLKGAQSKLDANKNGKLDKQDFKKLRDEKVDEAVEKTKTGIKHTADAGGYGRRHTDDEDEDGKKVKSDAPKKGRGRPKKGGDETGEVKKYNFDALSAFGGGKKPKKEIGKVSKKHKIATPADREKFDESFSKWDTQLKALLESKQINEGLSVSTSVGQEHGPDSVSITASDEDAHELLKLIQTAGLGLRKDPQADLMTAHGDSSPFSAPSGDEEPAGDIEVVDFDGAQDEISGEEDDGMSAMKQMLAAMGIGKEAAQEPKHPEGFDGEADEAEEETDTEVEVTTSDDEESEDEGGEENPFDSEESDEEESEDDSEEEADDEESEDDSEEESEEIEEAVETQCNECGGAIHEGEHHECSHQKEEDQLNEWANKRGGSTHDDEQYTADMKFMMDVISGGINGKKKDQTVMPGTQVKVSEGYTIDVAEEMRKLAGIK